MKLRDCHCHSVFVLPIIIYVHILKSILCCLAYISYCTPTNMLAYNRLLKHLILI